MTQKKKKGIRIQTIKIKPTVVREEPDGFGGVTIAHVPNPSYEAGRRQKYIIHKA